MLRHVVVLTFPATHPREELEALAEELRALPAQIPEIRGYEVGLDLGLREGNGSVVVVADFDDADGWRAYASHPHHLDVIARRITPSATGRAAAQFER